MALVVVLELLLKSQMKAKLTVILNKTYNIFPLFGAWQKKIFHLSQMIIWSGAKTLTVIKIKIQNIT